MFEQMRPRVRGHVGWLGVLGVVDSLCALPACVLAAGAEISDSGSVRFNYPIAAPAGAPKGFPDIALTYSRAPNGPIGTGWSLRGVSVISRCDGNKLLDGAIQCVYGGDSDRLCVDGRRLIAASSSGSPVAFNTEDQLGKSCTGDWIVWADLDWRAPFARHINIRCRSCTAHKPPTASPFRARKSSRRPTSTSPTTSVATTGRSARSRRSAAAPLCPTASAASAPVPAARPRPAAPRGNRSP